MLQLISAILQGFWRIGGYITKKVMIKTLRLISAILQGCWKIGEYITKEVMIKTLRLISAILQGSWKIGEYITKEIMIKTLRLISAILQGSWRIGEYITKEVMIKTLRLISAILQGSWRIGVHITKEVMIKTLRLISAILQGFWRIGVYITKEVRIKTLRLISAILQGSWRIGVYITKGFMKKTLQLISAILQSFWRIGEDTYTKKVRNSRRSLLLLRIREVLPSDRFPDHDEKLNDAIWIAGMKLAEGFDEEKPDQDPDSSIGGIKIERFRGIYNAHEERVEEIINSVKNNRRLQAIQKKNRSVSHRWGYFPGKRKELAAYYREQAKLDPDVASLTGKSPKEIYKDTRKEIKRAEKSLEISIDFFLSDLRTVAAFVFPPFFIIGYLYNTILFSCFDIEVSNFFSVEDYTTSSIDRTVPPIMFALAYAVLMHIIFRRFHYYPQKSKYQIVQERSRSPSPKAIFLYTEVVPFILYSVGFFSGGILLIFSSGDDDWFRLLYADEAWWLGIIGLIAMMAVVSTIIGRTVVKKNPKRPISASFSFAFLLLLLVYLVSSLMVRIHAINHDELDDLKRYEFTFSKTYPYQEKEKDMVLIANGREFYIFRDIKSKTSIVVPREEIVSVKDIKNKKNQDNFISKLKASLIGQLKALIGQLKAWIGQLKTSLIEQLKAWIGQPESVDRVGKPEMTR